MTSVAPFLMFQGQAEEAMRLYAELVPGSSIVRLDRYGAEALGAEGSVLAGELVLGGLTVLCNDSVEEHPFTFTPSVSLFLSCDSGPEVDRLAGALADRGAVLMPADGYGFSSRFAWVTDRFGVSWQLNCP